MHVLFGFLSWRDQVEYEKEQRFTNEFLFKITGEEFGDFMEELAYDDIQEGCNADDLHSPKARSNTIEYNKKAVSWYMPNRLQAWNSDAQNGNPTRSVQVNDIIKDLKKQECRGTGVASQATRPIEECEWEQMVSSFFNLFYFNTILYLSIVSCLLG